MAAVSRSSSGTHALPEEVISFRNIQATFPGIFEDGLKLLAEVAGKIQVMRLETELFPTLRVETNKETLKSHERAYKEIQPSVVKYIQTLESVTEQIQRAIQCCTDVTQKDVRCFTDRELGALKVHDFCQKILPTLHDWHSEGTLLHKRFTLVMTKDYKHYNESIVNFEQTINPRSWTLGGIASSLSSLLFSQTESEKGSESQPAAVNDGTEKKK